jgi:hypothetical protein
MAPAASRILMASMTLRRGGVAALAPSPAVGRWAGGDSGKQTRKRVVEESLVEESLEEIKKKLSGELSGKDNYSFFLSDGVSSVSSVSVSVSSMSTYSNPW